VPAIPGRRVDLAHGQVLAKREWLAAFDGAFHASRHARSDGRVAVASAPDVSVPATTSAAITNCLRLTAIQLDLGGVRDGLRCRQGANILAAAFRAG
jgi:hypothetical protein